MHMMGGLLARVVVRSKRRGRGRNFLMARGPRGFTVVEVLIVLAVTGMLFVSAAVLIAGRRAQTEFNQAIRQIQTQIQQVINEVATGYYPNANNFQCSAGAGGPILNPGSGTEQGANSGCIFLGKAIQMGLTGTDPEEFVVFPIAGLQKTAAGNEVTSLAEAAPVAIAPNSTESLPDNSITTQLQGGITSVRMTYTQAGVTRPIGVVAFVNKLASYTGQSIVSGSQQVSVVPVDDGSVDSALQRTALQGATAINTSLASSTQNPSGGVQICLMSGGTKQSGLITIGNSARQLSVTLTIKSNTDCS